MSKENAEAMKWLLDHNLVNINLIHIIAMHPEAQRILPLIQNSEIVVFSVADMKEFGKKIGVELGTDAHT